MTLSDAFIALSLALALVASPAAAQSLPAFDFHQATEAARWRPDHDISALRATSEGMEVAISGTDPYLHGPAADFPEGQDLWLTVEIRADRSGMGQVFYYREGAGASEEASVRFPVVAGGWRTIRLALPPLWPRTVLRLDPPGDGGKAVFGSLRFAARTLLPEPAWLAPEPPALADALTVRSGALELRHARNRLGCFGVFVSGRMMAIGHSRPLIGYTSNGQVRWLDVAAAAIVTTARDRDRLTVTARLSDPDGGAWTIVQRFQPDRYGAKTGAGGISVTTSVTVDQDRDVAFLPMLFLFPGSGSFGASKAQALFAGLEYLEGDDPSSSEKDIIGPGARRQVPDNLKVTFPLMAVCAGDRYVALAWHRDPRFSAVFDSPDRLFGSGGHVMGALYPGSDGQNREEGRLLPYGGETLRAGRPVVFRGTIMGGSGGTVVPAIQGYVARYGLPAPLRIDGWRGYSRAMAAGWLDSGVRSGSLYRHAWPGSFTAGPAADAPIWMDYLASQTRDTALRDRLRQAAREAIAQVPEGQRNSAGVGHVRYPVPALVYGDAARNAVTARSEGNDLLRRFEPDGSVLYVPPAEGNDLSRTHWSREANGLAAGVVAALLDRVLASGDPALKREALRLLDALMEFDNTVPRGAQTWEVPLHTPDILASAYLVKAFTIGYELTGNPGYLARARYWAWTGVPFVYLAPETQPDGAYATIAVYGATQWVAPNWMGLPVQWCGLVYADALDRLARYDPVGPWKRLADGIAASGTRQTHSIALDPMRQGLLPDSFQLRSGLRNDVAINPGTLAPVAVKLYHRQDVYDYRVFRNVGWTLHTPGPITVLEERPGGFRARIAGWPSGPYDVLLTGVASRPRVWIDGHGVDLASPHVYDPANGLLVLQLSGHPVVKISMP